MRREGPRNGLFRACGAFSGKTGVDACPSQENGFKRRLLALGTSAVGVVTLHIEIHLVAREKVFPCLGACRGVGQCHTRRQRPDLCMAPAGAGSPG